MSHNEYDRLDRKVGHLDHEFTELRTTVAKLESGQAGIIDQLAVIAIAVNKPAPKANVLGWLSAGLMGLGLLGTIGYTSLSPVKENVGKLEKSEIVIRHEQVSMGKDVARLTSFHEITR